MKRWRAALMWLLVVCIALMSPAGLLSAEEDGAEQETEEPVPDSYYYEIESNQTAGWPQGPQIESASAAVMDLNTGTMLYSKQATEKQYPASTTKIMTTLLLIENCNLDDEITFSEIVYDLEEGSSHLGIQPGETMTLRDAAYGIMLASANDIANGVAEYMAGSLSGFADMMNQRAAEIGCVNTHFSNPHGLYSDDHYTCAYDMALIAKTAYENPVFREIVSTKEYTIPKTNLTDEERSFLNHHKMMQSGEEYYQEWCIGGKTGYTSECLNTLVTYGSKNGMDLVSVVFRVNGAGKAYTESTQILNYGFDNFHTKKYEKNDSVQTFYDIMGIRYFGAAEQFLSSAWKKAPFEDCSLTLVLPNTASEGALTYAVSEGTGNTRTISYQYSGQSVGTATIKMNPILTPAMRSFERNPKISAVAAEPAEDQNIQIENVDEVLDQAVSYLDAGYRLAADYTKENTLIVVAGGAVLLLFLLAFIVVLVFRCTADSRIRRKRMQEERQRRKREEEIERMTTAEIEAELRAVMEQERLRKERERQALAEAERAAREAEEMEWKARETERLLEQLEQERLGRSK